MLVIIGIVITLLLFLAICLLFLPLTLTVFIVLTAGSFIAVHCLQNPGSASRFLTHVWQAAPEFWLQAPEISAPELDSRSSTRTHASPRSKESRFSASFRKRGKENIAEYVRPVLKPRRFGHELARSAIQGQSPQTLRNSATNSNWRSPAPGDGNNFVPVVQLDDKLSFSRLPLSPILPPNKSVNSPELDLSTSMLRFNSGQDSLLHPSMHYPTHQPDMVASPALLPSVSWLKDGGGLSSPRQRRGLPRVQSPVMVRIASPLPDRPASPLFRKLATEEHTQKSSSADKVIMAIRQRQKRTAQDVSGDINTAVTPSDVRSESKRRKLNSTCGKVTPARHDVDMDLDLLPLKTMKNVFSASTRHGITSPTPRNSIISSVSSSRRSQGMLKRRRDTNSVEVEEEDGVSPIKKSVPPQLSKPTPPAQSAARKANAPRPAAKLTADIPTTFSPLRSGGKALYFEKNKETLLGQAERETTNGTPSKSGLKKKVLFTPKRSAHIQRVDTPGEYTIADKEEDRAQARERVSYLKEMLMEGPDIQTSQGASTSEAIAKPNSSLFTTAATTSSTLPSFSVGPLQNVSATSSTTATSSASAVTTTPSLGLLKTTSGTSLFPNSLAPGTEKATSAQTSQLNLPTSAAPTSLAASQASGGAAGFKLSTSTPTVTPQTSLGGSAALNAQGTAKPNQTIGTGAPLGLKIGGGVSGTQVDAKAQTTAANAMPSAAPSVPLSGGFSVAGQAPTFGTALNTSAPVASTASTTTGSSSAQPQFTPIFGTPAAPGAQTRAAPAAQPTSNPSSQPQSGGFQFGQSTGSAASTTPSKGGFPFGNKPATTSVLSGLASPFPVTAASSVPAAAQNKGTFSMSTPATPATSAGQGGNLQFTPVFGQPKPSQPSQPASTSGQMPSFTPIFGGASQTTNQATSGGVTFGAAPAPPTSATPATFNFGSAGASTTTTASSMASPFGSSTQPSPFGTSKPANAVGASIFGAAPTPAASLKPGVASTTKAGGMFGSGTTQQTPAFGAAPSGAASVFGSSNATSTQNGVFGSAATNKPAFGINPTATVTPFGASASQPTSQAASPFPFGATQPQNQAQPAQPSASGGFNFGAQKPAQSFNFGSAAAPNTGFQFGQAPSQPAQPTGGATQQTNFFSGAQAATPNQFGASSGFGSPAMGGGSTPAPAFGASPSQAASPGVGGLSIGAGGANTNQRRANRLRQVRNRAGRR